MSSRRFVNPAQTIRVGQMKDGSWEARYLGISALGSTRTKALHRITWVLNDIDRFAAECKRKQDAKDAS